MKKTIFTLAALALSVTAAKASISLGSNAFNNAPGIAAGDIAYFIVDINGTGFASLSNASVPFTEGESLSSISAFGGGDFAFLPNNADFSGKKTATSLGATVLISGGFAGVNLSNGITTGDKFAAVVFSNSNATVLRGDTYTVWTDPTWVIPADGSSLTFSTTNGAALKAITSTSTALFSGTVTLTAVPEPSSFAALAGFAVLGLAASRRRRA